MTSYVPVRKNDPAGAIFYVVLAPQIPTAGFQANPTLATGDVKISKDGGAFANLGTLPDVDPDTGKAVKVTLSQAETNADNLQILFVDAAGAEWCDLFVTVQTTAKNFDDLATAAALATAQTSIDDIPTNAELAASQAAADDATLAAIAALVIPTAVAIRVEMDSNSTRLAAIDGKTTNLPTDPADQSLIIAATNALVALLGTPAGASVSADILAAKGDTAAIKIIADRLATAIELDGAVYRFTTNALEQAPTGSGATAAAVRDAVFAQVTASGVTFLEQMRGEAAILLGKKSGAGTTTEIFRDPADTKDVVTATVTSTGNRTAIARDLA